MRLSGYVAALALAATGCGIDGAPAPHGPGGGKADDLTGLGSIEFEEIAVIDASNAEPEDIGRLDGRVLVRDRLNGTIITADLTSGARDVTALPQGLPAAVYDLDEDGRSEILVWQAPALQVLTARAGCQAVACMVVASEVMLGDEHLPSIAKGDFDGDDRPDLLILGRGEVDPLQAYVSLGRGGLEFEAPSAVFEPGSPEHTEFELTRFDLGESINAADIDQDGRDEFVLVGQSVEGAQLYLVSPDGAGHPVAARTPLMAVQVVTTFAIADVDLDGLPDLVYADAGFATDFPGRFGVILNTAQGLDVTAPVKSPLTVNHMETISTADLAGDERPEYLVPGGSDHERVELFAEIAPTEASQRRVIPLRGGNKRAHLIDVTGDERPEIVAGVVDPADDVLKTVVLRMKQP